MIADFDFSNMGSTLIASLLWGSVGTGFFVFGKKQGSMSIMLGGIGLMGISYFTTSAWLMSLVSIAIIALVIWIYKRFN